MMKHVLIRGSSRLLFLVSLVAGLPYTPVHAGPTPAIIAQSLVAQTAAAATDADRARHFAGLLAGLENSKDRPLDEKLHDAWAAYLLAGNDTERTRLLAFAATVPDARARMLIGSFREFPALRKSHAEADRLNSELLLQGLPEPAAPGKRQSPRELFGLNPFDAPHTGDGWTDPHGFVGRWTTQGVSLDLIAYPADNFLAVLNTGSAEPKICLLGIRSGRTLYLLGRGTSGQLEDDQLTLNVNGKVYRLQRIAVGVTSFDRRPSGARVLLDASTGLRNFRHANGEAAAWKFLPGGVMEIDPAKGSVFTRDAWGDLHGYLEFRHAYNSEGLGPRRGNSGIYLFNSYEVQLIDSFGLPPEETSEGSVYHLAIPRVTASAPPLEWQSIEFLFRAPRFDAGGAKIENARLTLWLNGVKIHDDVELPHTTGGSPAGGREMIDPQPPQPFMLQNHGGILQFRNIWVLPVGAGA